jgi:hypothetical protein
LKSFLSPIPLKIYSLEGIDTFLKELCKRKYVTGKTS